MNDKEVLNAEIKLLKAKMRHINRVKVKLAEDLKEATNEAVNAVADWLQQTRQQPELAAEARERFLA